MKIYHVLPKDLNSEPYSFMEDRTHKGKTVTNKIHTVEVVLVETLDQLIDEAREIQKQAFAGNLEYIEKIANLKKSGVRGLNEKTKGI